LLLVGRFPLLSGRIIFNAFPLWVSGDAGDAAKVPHEQRRCQKFVKMLSDVALSFSPFPFIPLISFNLALSHYIRFHGGYKNAAALLSLLPKLSFAWLTGSCTPALAPKMSSEPNSTPTPGHQTAP
jgi:hypothetical protein